MHACTCVRACALHPVRATKMGMARTPLPLKGLRLPLRFALYVSLPLQLSFPLPLVITLLFPIRFAPALDVRYKLVIRGWCVYPRLSLALICVLRSR